MQLIEQTNGGKTRWTVKLITYPDGSIRIKTGSPGPYYRQLNDQQLLDQSVKNDGTRPVRVEDVPKVVVRAALNPVSGANGWHWLEDRDDPGYYVGMTSGVFQELFDLAKNRQLTVVDGYIEMDWTVKNTGGSLSIQPYQGVPNIHAQPKHKDEDEDALDVSDFVPKI